MSEAVVTSRISSEENQTTCIISNKQCDEDKSGFPLDAYKSYRMAR